MKMLSVVNSPLQNNVDKDSTSSNKTVPLNSNTNDSLITTLGSKPFLVLAIALFFVIVAVAIVVPLVLLLQKSEFFLRGIKFFV